MKIWCFDKRTYKVKYHKFICIILLLIIINISIIMQTLDDFLTQLQTVIAQLISYWSTTFLFQVKNVALQREFFSFYWSLLLWWCIGRTLWTTNVHPSSLSSCFSFYLMDLEVLVFYTWYIYVAKYPVSKFTQKDFHFQSLNWFYYIFLE